MKKRILIALFAVVLAVTMLVTSVGATSVASGFSDYAEIQAEGWPAAAVEYVAENGLMNGTDGKFDGNGALTRAQMVRLLYNFEVAVYGAPVVDTSINPFEDIDDVASWALDAICWAVENGLVGGTTATTFEPDTPLSRGMMVTLFYRYIAFKGLEDKLYAEKISRADETVEVAGYEFEEVYTDWMDEETGLLKTDIYYVDAAMYALQVGLIGGIKEETPDGDIYYFDAEGTCNRYMAAVVITRLHKYFTLPTLEAEINIDEFKAEWESFHNDIILAVNNAAYENRGNAELSLIVPSYETIYNLFEERIAYDHDKYELVLEGYPEFALQFIKNTSDCTLDVRLVTEDGEYASYIVDFDAIKNPYDAVKDTAGFDIVPGRWFAGETRTEEVKAEVQADLEATLDEFLAYYNFSTVEGQYEIHIKTASAHPNVGTRALSRALVEAGIGSFAYRIGPDMLSFNTEGMISIQKPDGTWTDSFQFSDDDPYYAGNSGIEFVDGILQGIAGLATTGTFEFTTNLPIRLANWGYTGAGGTNPAFDATAPVANRLVKFVFEYDTTVNTMEKAVVVTPGEHKPAEDVINSILCDDCGAFHYIANEETFDAAQMLADFQIISPKFFTAQYVVTNVVFDDALNAPIADLETKSGNMTITLADRFNPTLTTEYTVPATITYNATFADGSKDLRTTDYVTLAVAKAVGVHPGESALFFDESVQSTIDAAFDRFEEKALCVCGKVHYGNRKASEAKWEEVIKDIRQGFFDTDNGDVIAQQGQSKYRFYIFSDFNLVTMANTFIDSAAYNAITTTLAADSPYEYKITFAFLDVETMTLTYRTYTFSHTVNSNRSSTATSEGEAVYQYPMEEGKTMKYNIYAPYYFANKGFMKDGMDCSAGQVYNEDSNFKPNISIPEGVCPFEYVKASYQASLVPPAQETPVA